MDLPTSKPQTAVTVPCIFRNHLYTSEPHCCSDGWTFRVHREGVIFVVSFRQFPLCHNHGRDLDFRTHSHQTPLSIRMDGITNVWRPTTLPLVRHEVGHTFRRRLSSKLDKRHCIRSKSDRPNHVRACITWCTL